MLALQDPRAPPDWSDPRDPMDQKVLLGFVDQKVLRGSQGWQTYDPAQMVQQAPWVPRGTKVLKDLKESKDYGARQEKPGKRDLGDLRGHPGFGDQPVLAAWSLSRPPRLSTAQVR